MGAPEESPDTMTRLFRGYVCGLPPICFCTRGCAKAASLIHGRLSRGSALWPPHDLFQYERACHRSLPKSCAGASRSHCASYLGLPFVGSSPSVSVREGAPEEFTRSMTHLSRGSASWPPHDLFVVREGVPQELPEVIALGPPPKKSSLRKHRATMPLR